MTPVQAPAAQGKLGVLSVHNAEIRADDGSTVAVCYGAPHSHADRRARILAHAHNCHAKLVEALREARQYVYDYGSEASMAPVVARIDAAISRATGSEQ